MSYMKIILSKIIFVTKILHNRIEENDFYKYNNKFLIILLKNKFYFVVKSIKL